jgi:hypothetical protein
MNETVILVILTALLAVYFVVLRLVKRPKRFPKSIALANCADDQSDSETTKGEVQFARRNRGKGSSPSEDLEKVDSNEISFAERDDDPELNLKDSLSDITFSLGPRDSPSTIETNEGPVASELKGQQRGIDPQLIGVFMRVVITFVVFAGCGYVVLSKQYDESMTAWASGLIGAIIGHWFGFKPES